MNVREAILSRRSIRKYTNQPVSDEDLNDLIEAATYAPSGTNLQPWYFLALRSDESMAKFKVFMRKTAENFMPVLRERFAKNPEVIDETRNFLLGLGGAPLCVLVFMLKDAKSDKNYDDNFTLLQSVSAGIENLLLAAVEKGLGACWMTAPVKAGLSEDIRKEFAPDHGQFVAAITLGYPDANPGAPKRREGRFDVI
ncbi:MAG: nitroreductase family protein [Synergistaceae bacterium]|jgi:nitroreductase|nr:nitroreductase family protein [Synergistaceae bacterium]